MSYASDLPRAQSLVVLNDLILISRALHYEGWGAYQRSIELVQQFAAACSIPEFALLPFYEFSQYAHHILLDQRGALLAPQLIGDLPDAEISRLCDLYSTFLAIVTSAGVSPDERQIAHDILSNSFRLSREASSLEAFLFNGQNAWVNLSDMQRVGRPSWPLEVALLEEYSRKFGGSLLQGVEDQQEHVLGSLDALTPSMVLFVDLCKIVVRVSSTKINPTRTQMQLLQSFATAAHIDVVEAMEFTELWELMLLLGKGDFLAPTLLDVLEKHSRRRLAYLYVRFAEIAAAGAIPELESVKAAIWAVLAPKPTQVQTSHLWRSIRSQPSGICSGLRVFLVATI